MIAVASSPAKIAGADCGIQAGRIRGTGIMTKNRSIAFNGGVHGAGIHRGLRAHKTHINRVVTGGCRGAVMCLGAIHIGPTERRAVSGGKTERRE
jgi:hypothetical protein